MPARAAATRFAAATPPCAGTGFGASSMPTARKLFPAATNTPVPRRMVLHWYAKTACGALLSPRHWRRELRFRACGATVKSAGQAAAAHLSVRLVQPRPPHAAARVRPFPLRETAPRPSRQEPGGARCCFLSLPMLTRQSSAQAAPPRSGRNGTYGPIPSGIFSCLFTRFPARRPPQCAVFHSRPESCGAARLASIPAPCSN